MACDANCYVSRLPRMGERPPCRVCKTSFHVKTLGGGTKPRYRYHCKKCSVKWQQVPPKLARHAPEVHPPTAPRLLKDYTCTLCRQRKFKNHKYVCPGFQRVISS